MIYTVKAMECEVHIGGSQTSASITVIAGSHIENFLFRKSGGGGRVQNLHF